MWQSTMMSRSLWIDKGPRGIVKLLVIIKCFSPFSDTGDLAGKILHVYGCLQHVLPQVART
jgi:hypothetical protein